MNVSMTTHFSKPLSSHVYPNLLLVGTTCEAFVLNTADTTSISALDWVRFTSCLGQILILIANSFSAYSCTLTLGNLYSNLSLILLAIIDEQQRIYSPRFGVLGSKIKCCFQLDSHKISELNLDNKLLAKVTNKS